LRKLQNITKNILRFLQKQCSPAAYPPALSAKYAAYFVILAAKVCLSQVNREVGFLAGR
jgi:hypothetical protein